MKICDRCFHKDGSAVMASDEMTLRNEDRHIDLCESCRSDISLFIDSPEDFKRKPGRKKEK